MLVLARFLSIVLFLSLHSVALGPVPLFAHSGGRDSYGCHHDRKHGGYHCHAGPLAGQSFASQAEMLAVSRGGTPDRTTPGARANAAPTPSTPGGSDGSEQVCIREHRTQQIMCGEPVR